MNASAPQEQQRRPRAKFVTAVWGQAYIERFATLSLPSFLAAGNLPALAEATDLEVVICTRAADIGFFEAQPAVQRMQRLCPVRFIDIEDLVTTGIYGVTLTLAYARAVIGCGEDMLKTHFVFMNADFVLADGSLRSLAKHILAGRAIVLGPSFRAVAEALEPELRAAVNADGLLEIAPRELAARALRHAHPTTDAKIRNQEFVHSRQPNQFFWWVDKQTLLGRYYLIFMLCLKPERKISSVNSYCDYAFIPELCPSGDEVAMGDSDEFFMLELQSHDQELDMLRLGRQTNAQIARSLATWATAEHRRAARHDIVFHAGEIPRQIEEAKAQAAAFVEDIARRLSAPRPHTNHVHWVRGVASWRARRIGSGATASPPELSIRSGYRLWALLASMPPSAVVNLIWEFAYAMQRRVLGQWPHVTPLHYLWMDRWLLQETIREAMRTGADGGVLVVRQESERVDPLLEPGTLAHLADVKTLLEGDVAVPASRPHSALIYMIHGDLPKARSVVEQCRSLLAPDGVCHLFIQEHYTARMAGPLANELMLSLEEIAGIPAATSTCRFVGGPLRRDARMLMHRATEIGRTHGLLAGPWAGVLLALAVPLSAILNAHVRLTGARRDFVPSCSSVAIRIEFGSRTSSARPPSAA